METVSWSFVVLQDKDINQGKFKRYWQVQQRGGYSKMEEAFYRPKMLSDDTPSFWASGSRWSAKLIGSRRFLLVTGC